MLDVHICTLVINPFQCCFYIYIKIYISSICLCDLCLDLFREYLDYCVSGAPTARVKHGELLMLSCLLHKHKKHM